MAILDAMDFWGLMSSRGKLRVFLIAILALLTLPVIAWAACSSPTASAGAREYFNTTGKTFKLCDGTNWQDFTCADPTWTSTLVGYWKLDESAGNALDSSGNGNTGTSSNITYMPQGGWRDGAFSFNGSNSYVNAGSATILDNTFAAGADFSISAWIYPKSGGTGLGQIIGKDTSTGGATTASQGWTLVMNSSTQLRFMANTCSTTSLAKTSNASALTANAWNHVVVTVSAFNCNPGNITFYVNNAVSTGVNSGAGTVSSINTAADLTIGNNKVSNLGRGFDGYIDDVYVFSGVLTSTEIATLYARGCKRLGTCSSAGQLDYSASDTAYKTCDGTTSYQAGCTANLAGASMTSGLVGRWKYDEGTGTSVADTTAYGSNMLLTNFAGTNPTWSTGYTDGATTFDWVSNQQVGYISSQTHHAIAGSWSVYTWVKLNTLPPSGSGAPLVAKNDASNQANYYLFVDNNSFGSGSGFGIGFQQSAGSTFYGGFYPTTLTTGIWYQLVGVYDSSAQMLYVYLNGTRVASQSVAGFTPTSSVGGPLLFAYLNSAANVSLDDTRIYNRALSATDVQSFYNYDTCSSGQTCSTAGMVQYDSAANALYFCNGTRYLPLAK